MDEYSWVYILAVTGDEAVNTRELKAVTSIGCGTVAKSCLTPDGEYMETSAEVEKLPASVGMPEYDTLNV
jgi:hypothetical protein